MLTALDLDLLALFTHIDITVWEKVIRTIVVYLVIAILVRIAGKRLLAQMNSLDLVVVLLLSNVVQNAIIGPDNSLIGGLIGAVVLVLFNAGLDRLLQASPRLRVLVEGRPADLIVDGRIDRSALRRLGLTEDELDVAIGHLGADHVEEVDLAKLLPGGQLTVDLAPDARPATRAELRDAVADILAALDARLPPAGRST